MGFHSLGRETLRSLNSEQCKDGYDWPWLWKIEELLIGLLTSLWTGSGWRGLIAVGRVMKELGESEVAEEGMMWGLGHIPSSFSSPLSSRFLFTPPLTREPFQSLLLYARVVKIIVSYIHANEGTKKLIILFHIHPQEIKKCSLYGAA